MAHVTSRDSSTRKTKSRHPPTAAGRSPVRTDALRLSTAAVHSQKSDRCCQWQRLSFIRRGVVPNHILRKRNALKGLIGRPFRASKAHRLPKSVGYVSARPRQVKQKWLKMRVFGSFGNRIPGICRPTHPLSCDVTPVSLMSLRYFARSPLTNTLNSATDIGRHARAGRLGDALLRRSVRGPCSSSRWPYAAGTRRSRSLRSTCHKSDQAYE